MKEKKQTLRGQSALNENVCSVKDTAKKMKKQDNWGKNIFVKHICDKRLVFKIHKELLKLTNKRVN